MSTLSKEQKKQKFIDAFASIRDELLQYLVKENMPTDAQEWYKRVRLPPLSPFPLIPDR